MNKGLYLFYLIFLRFQSHDLWLEEPNFTFLFSKYFLHPANYKMLRVSVRRIQEETSGNVTLIRENIKNNYISTY